MTKEQVQAVWDKQATQVIEKLAVKGGTSDMGWNQTVCGLITLRTVLELQSSEDIKSEEDRKAAMLAACTIGANSSQQGQRLFSSKKEKSTALANKLTSLID